jgi:hypothetical protein
MSTATVESQLEDQEVDRTLPLTAHEVRTLHLVLGVVMEKPGTFGVRGNGSAETKRILIETAGGMRDKLGVPPRAPLAKAPRPAAKAKPKTTAPLPAPVVVSFSAPATPVQVTPAAAPPPAAEQPVATPTPPPAVPEAPAKNNGTKHFLIAYSRTKNKPVAELVFDSYERAFGARTAEAAQWSDDDDVEMHLFSGPNRAVFVSAQPKFFRARSPKKKL